MFKSSLLSVVQEVRSTMDYTGTKEMYNRQSQREGKQLSSKQQEE
jgi:hypothetical protein